MDLSGSYRKIGAPEKPGMMMITKMMVTINQTMMVTMMMKKKSPGTMEGRHIGGIRAIVGVVFGKYAIPCCWYWV